MSKRLPRRLADWLQEMRAGAPVAALVLALVGMAPNPSRAGAAAACDTVPPLNSLEMTQPLNLGELKQQIRHYACSGAYDSELAKVVSEAQAYVEKRAGEVVKPALVLDIDETSLSNFREILANDFGYIYDGACDVLPKAPCGWQAWLLSARAEAIAPTLAVKAARTKAWRFLHTGRRDVTTAQRDGQEPDRCRLRRLGRLTCARKPTRMHRWCPKSGTRQIAAQGYTISPISATSAGLTAVMPSALEAAQPVLFHP